MGDSTSLVRVRVDRTNPGQFFACCGMLELAARLWHDTEGWFDDSSFCMRAAPQPGGTDLTITSLLEAVTKARFAVLAPDDSTASPLRLESPFNLRLDWWTDTRTGGDRLKVWAGRMSNIRIAQAMQNAIAQERTHADILNYRCVVYEIDDPAKKVEPFYFDARRGSSARPLDVGFSPDPLGLTSVAYPYVEFLCFVGLQRMRPAPTITARVFEYFSWDIPLPALLAACAAAGYLDVALDHGYWFQVGFRTDQRKHKAFMPATRSARRRNGRPVGEFDSWLDESGPAALVIREHLVPVEGRDGVVFPSTFAATEDKSFKGGYNIDEFGPGRNVCLIDSVGSQANRIEPIFATAPYKGLIPQVRVRVGNGHVNLLEAGHRAGDALARCAAGLGGELHAAFKNVLKDDVEGRGHIEACG